MATPTSSEFQTALDNTFGDKVNEVSENVRKVVQNLLPQILKGVNLSGSGVNQLRELGWETGNFEQQFRDRFQQIGQRVSNIQLPPVVTQWIEKGKKWASEHPFLAMIVVALAISCALPVVAFLSFAFITLLVTFTGFLFVEGTILGVAAVVLGGALLIVGGVTLSIVSCVLVTVYVTAKIYSKITGDPNPQRFLRKIPYIGHFFANFEHAGSNGEAPKIPNGVEDETGSDESLANTD